MNPQVTTINRSQSAVSSTNKLVRNTYMLLSMTLAFAALTAGISMSLTMTSKSFPAAHKQSAWSALSAVVTS